MAAVQVPPQLAGLNTASTPSEPPRITGTKAASYHAPPVTGPTGATVHVLRCLSSQIHCGFHLFPHLAHLVTAQLRASAYVVITDTNVARLHLDALCRALQAALDALGAKPAPRVLTRILPPGETSKSRQTKADIEDWMLANHLTRDTVVIAMGGGVIGDLVGFVAATFMRGVRFVQLPTTLLAMVDSAVGGKTAIDTPHGKNLIGAFHQPEFIFVDAAMLETLPEREFSNGMAEVVKTAAIWDAADFSKLESRAADIRRAVMDRGASPADGTAFRGRTLETRTEAQSLLLDVIRGSVGVKAHIVTIDEKETGLRNLVNFGHSIGHAIEAVLTPDMLHGECVSIGMILEAELARSMHGLSQVAVGRLARCLEEYSLPITLEDARVTRLSKASQLSVDRLLDIMRVDKKNAGSVKKVVLLSHIGGTVEERASSVPDDVIRRVLSKAVRPTPILVKPNRTVVTMSTPGSKSISNRALVLAALAKGTCRLRNLLHSDDTRVMMAALQELRAADFAWADAGETIVVTGREGRLTAPAGGKHLYLQNAGTAARFMTTVCALVGGPEAVVVTGNKRMKQRPIGPLVDALTANGVAVEYLESSGCLPLAIRGPHTGVLAGGRIELAASVSSQYVSSILLCAPYAKDEVLLDLVGGAVISQPYIDMTIAMMRDFGIEVERLRDAATGKLLDTYRVPRGYYVSPLEYHIESDASSATYPLAVAAITGTECTIPNIGSSSLQGDARFAQEVLAPMGCSVEQTATSTTVRGPPLGELRQLGTVDMETMTDAFLTASVLLAVAPKPALSGGASSTRITGIANQRVKECNRIRAMIDELAKFGVRAVEHEDGLEVFGIPYEELRPGVQVHCYDDHRVAMAFSVLATLAPGDGCVILEKRCVEKTWPSWWDDLERKLGIGVDGVDVETTEIGSSNGMSSTAAAASAVRTEGRPMPQRYDADATIFCIGMRGSGKTLLGGLGAAALERPFLDADAIFDERYGLNGFVAKHGWPAFRQKETELLRELIDTKARGHLVSLGGGVVETPENRRLLAEYARSRGPVVHVVRDMDEVCAFLETSDRPAYGEPVRDVYERRRPWFAQCSSYQLVSLADTQRPADSSRPSIQPRKGLAEQVGRFFRFVAGVETNQAALAASRPTYFLSLTFSDVRQGLSLLDTVTAGADAVEFRVDLLNPAGKPSAQPSVPPAEYVASQLTALRQQTSLPIVYTVRTASQGGMLPDEAQDEYFALVELGLRLGCEYVDLELRWPEERLAVIVAAKGRSQILASWHDWTGGLRWDSEEALQKYRLAAKFGDVAKLVGRATTYADNLAIEAFRARVAAEPDAKPLLAINMGEAGQASRILNTVLSPVTHAALPSRAAPGQLSFADIQRARHLLGLLPARRFALFGQPIGASLSPCLHNTAFAELGFPHRYERHETAEVDASVEALVRSPDFGGASVTIPHKLNIMRLLDSLTHEAKAIGAVNTIIPQRRGDGAPTLLVGDNTDWIAIHALARRALSTSQSAPSAGADDFVALVLGAGGSARAALYAVAKLGCGRVLLYNRTADKARALAREVPEEWRVEVVERLDALPVAPTVVVSNVPAHGTRLAGDEEGKDGGADSAGVVLPAQMLSSPRGGVVIDMAYKPAHTPLLELVSRANARSKSSGTQDGGGARWTAIPGLCILLEQGCHQFVRWTGVEAPRHAVEEACWAEYTRQA